MISLVGVGIFCIQAKLRQLGRETAKSGLRLCLFSEKQNLLELIVSLRFSFHSLKSSLPCPLSFLQKQLQT
jgi:hypothetical protein